MIHHAGTPLGQLRHNRRQTSGGWVSMLRWRILAILWLALLAHSAVAQPANTVLVLPFTPAPSLNPSGQFIGVALQNLFENALVEIHDLKETWFIGTVWDRFGDLDQWNSFLSGKALALDTSAFTCVVSGEVSSVPQGYTLTMRIKSKSASPAPQSVAIDFPQLVEVRRSFVHELRNAGCSPVEAPRAALWEEQLPASAAAILGRGLATFMESSIFSGNW